MTKTILTALLASFLSLPALAGSHDDNKAGHDHAAEHAEDHDHADDHDHNDEHDHADGHDDHDHDHEHARHLIEVGDLRLLHGWAAEGADPLLIFVEIQNTGTETQTLEDVHGDWGSFDIVAPVLKDGATMLMPMSALPLPAGSRMMLAPGAVAIRAQGLSDELHEGHVEQLELHFSGGKEAEIDVEILPEGTTRHPHTGHKH